MVPMSYEAALTKAWNELAGASKSEVLSVPLMGDTYQIDIKNRLIASLSCNVPAKEHLSILILHYAAHSLKNIFVPSGEWVSFKDIEGGEIYYPAFREGAIKPLLRKYGAKPEAILNNMARFSGKLIRMGDVAVEIETFKDVFIRIIFWKGDDEFGPEATILFDKSLTGVFPTEDIAVFLRIVAHGL
jgi:hypothetical protein